ncbi:MAG: hypothetical protein DRP57_06850 [Spirochaetes bacterium]|nr:MAG: hypothetical protein DRP57_06850 [Spirochaetota bacterium]
MKTANRISAVIILILCAVFWFQTKNFSPYSALFPRVVIIILALLSLTLLILSFSKQKVIKDDKEVVFDPAEITIKYFNIVISLSFMVLWVFFIPILGFYLTSIIFFSFMSIYLDTRNRTFLKIMEKIGIILLLVTAFYLFFTRFLYIPFPEGILSI